jgi:hypothetical protein
MKIIPRRLRRRRSSSRAAALSERRAPAAPGELPPHALAVLRSLRDHRVEHVLTGDLAAAALGKPWADDAVAIVPSRYERNLDRLLEALRDLDVAVRDPFGEIFEAELTPRHLRDHAQWTLITGMTELRVDFEPSYRDLYIEARRLSFPGGVEVEVQSGETVTEASAA